jgi:protein disulfide-isomerase
MENNLKIQIWSDVMCPYCYIGKRRIENALEKFEHKENVEIEWKSFELDANFPQQSNENIVDHLAKKYQKDTTWAKEMMDNMTQNAKNSGLDFHFEKAILANSHNAHRLLHLAKNHNLGDALKEQLLKAYLTDGKNINDLETLSLLGQQVGLNKEETETVLNSDTFSKEVKQDIATAREIGVQGVPFFVFDNKYAISGAQPVETFTQTLEKAWQEGEFTSTVQIINSQDGSSCGIDGCD